MKRATAAPALSPWILASLLAAAATPRLPAHRLLADAIARGGALVIEAYFSDDSPLRDARVTVTGPDGIVVAEGRTDAGGVFRFAPESAVDLDVVIDDRVGHRLEMQVPAARIEPLLADAPGPSGDAVIARSKEGGLSWLGPLWVRILAGLGVIALLSVIAALAAARRLRTRRPDAS
ncbi:MAG: hypothetical protein JXA90_15510 [Planctomycetes bacterium]|nr:hypothetical protein [Planctomycetota bacterium]